MASVEPQDTPAARRIAWPLLVLSAALQAYEGLSSLAYVPMGVATPSSGLGGLTVAAAGALQAVGATVALVLASRRDFRGVTLAVAGCIMLGWLSTLPSVVDKGLDFSGSARLVSAYFVVSPIIAIGAAALAWRNSFPVLAAFIVTAPTLALLLFVLAFGVVIAVHGF